MADYDNEQESKKGRENQAASNSAEWDPNRSNENVGKLIELKGDFVIVTGTLEAGNNIDGLPSFRITTYDLKSGKPTEQQILMDDLLKNKRKDGIGTGVKIDDKVEIRGQRTERGYIKAIALLNLETGVKTGELTHRRYWILVLGFFFLIIGLTTMTKFGTAPIFILISVPFFLIFPFFKKENEIY